jgi:hypothetical protein
MINLYDLHDAPHKLNHFDIKHTLSPELAWEHGLATRDWDEKLLAKDAEISYDYAKTILRDRFKLGEPIIAKNGYIAYKYARDILKDRFKEAEPAIANFYAPNIPVRYAEKFLKGPFPEAEENIAKDSNYSAVYATDVLHNRFKLGEPAIFKDPKVCASYCDHFKIKMD